MPDNSEGAPFFFLSYARSRLHDVGSCSGSDPWVSQFFADLCLQVNIRIAVPSDTVAGFMDREPLSGEMWPLRLQRALANCRVFVPLYSRRYFQSKHCGKEWSAFVRRFADGDMAVQTAIIPALWVPVEKEFVPDAARSILCDDAGVQAYAEYGFYGIMKLSRYRADYEKALQHLAGRIVDAQANSAAATVMRPDGRSMELA